MRYPLIRGYIRAKVECDICRSEESLLYRIGFDENRERDKVYCEDCKNKLLTETALIP